VEHGGERLKDTGKLPLTVRLWLADYFGSIGDERVLPLAESVLADLKPGAVGQEDLALQAVERLGWYYRDRGEHEKSAQAWLRLEPLVSKPGWEVPDSVIEAARQWKQAGQGDKAQAAYARIAPLGDVWVTSVAVGDQARELMASGQQAPAQKMLRDALPLAMGSEAQVLVQSFLARSLLLSGDLEGARSTAQQALDAYAKLPRQQAVLESMARATRDEAAGWIQSPIQIEPRELKLPAVKEGAQPIVRRLRVRTLKPATLAVTSSAPQIKARLLSEDGWGTAASTEQVLVIECAPGAPANAILSITSEQYPNVEAKVPVLSGAGS